jgi:hypothetical protein
MKSTGRMLVQNPWLTASGLSLEPDGNKRWGGIRDERRCLRESVFTCCLSASILLGKTAGRSRDLAPNALGEALSQGGNQCR